MYLGIQGIGLSGYDTLQADDGRRGGQNGVSFASDDRLEASAAGEELSGARRDDATWILVDRVEGKDGAGVLRRAVFDHLLRSLAGLFSWLEY